MLSGGACALAVWDHSGTRSERLGIAAVGESAALGPGPPADHGLGMAGVPVESVVNWV